MAIPAGNGKRVREFFFHVEVGMKISLPQWKEKMVSLELLVPETPLQVRWIERQKLWGVGFHSKNSSVVQVGEPHRVLLFLSVLHETKTAFSGVRINGFTIKDIVSKPLQPLIRLHMEQATHLYVVGFDFHASFIENEFRVILDRTTTCG
jgi:hypothetical protein